MAADSPLAAALDRRVAQLRELLSERPGAQEWRAALEGTGETVSAVAYPALCGPLRPGDRVLLNHTAVALGLGTGGVDLVIARLDDDGADEIAGREAGHVLKLRYSPLQHRVLCVEDPASPHRAAFGATTSLGGAPVVVAELHSQMAAAAIAAKSVRPETRISLVWSDSAALPVAWSRLLARLRGEGVLETCVSVGQAFGGDLEAVNLYSGLLAARGVAGADLILVAQGPGNVGTDTTYGFSGLALVEALHAASHLGGRPVWIPRLSNADPRARHQGLSHHTVTALRVAHCRVIAPLPMSTPAAVLAAVTEAGLAERHEWPRIDAQSALPALRAWEDALLTMGRTIREDQLFFEAAAAAGIWAASAVEA